MVHVVCTPARSIRAGEGGGEGNGVKPCGGFGLTSDEDGNVGVGEGFLEVGLGMQRSNPKAESVRDARLGEVCNSFPFHSKKVDR